VFIPSAPASLPVTGAPLRLDTLETASLLGGAGLLLGVYIVSLRRAKKH